jgi:hypothetical protein
MSDTNCAEIKTRLDAARAAYESLLSGGGVRSITDSDGSRIEYTTANLPSLASYIALLQAEYSGCINGTPTVVSKPVTFWF